MNLQRELFNESKAAAPETKPRNRAMEAVLKKQAEAFKTEFRAFAIYYARTHYEFLAEDIRFAYERTEKTQPSNWKASGGIIQRLVSQGVLIATGRSRYCKSGARRMMIYRGK